MDKSSQEMGASSSNNEFKGILASFSTTGEYPFSMEKSFTLQPGYHNLVAISAKHFSTTDDLKQLNPKDRNCFYPGTKRERNFGAKF